ncbi:sugar transferase [Shivajiella indica]|uniref:Sugar transferase n=1 Tax=Shivajiella indica TaxID=872115 RepID=A0ABW5BDK5_9BACT
METLISSPSNSKVFRTESDFVIKRYSENLLDSSQILFKRILDILISSLFLALVGIWLFPIIAILIKLDSKGPVFYKQLRDGQYNSRFICFKFRTMTYNPEDNFKQAVKHDPRITKIGAFLRKTSLDELPQLFNVLTGEMTLVGPRPHAVEMNQNCREVYDNYMLRHLVKPGITGLAQAKGFRGEIKSKFDMQSRLKLDLFYIEKWSLGLDIKIIFITIHSILFKNENAY